MITRPNVSIASHTPLLHTNAAQSASPTRTRGALKAAVHRVPSGCVPCRRHSDSRRIHGSYNDPHPFPQRPYLMRCWPKVDQLRPMLNVFFCRLIGSMIDHPALAAPKAMHHASHWRPREAQALGVRIFSLFMKNAPSDVVRAFLDDVVIHSPTPSRRHTSSQVPGA
jgi:hypothetical protein